jgi:hypothetical protein
MSCEQHRKREHKLALKAVMFEEGMRCWLCAERWVNALAHWALGYFLFFD